MYYGTEDVKCMGRRPKLFSPWCAVSIKYHSCSLLHRPLLLSHQYFIFFLGTAKLAHHFHKVSCRSREHPPDKLLPARRPKLPANTSVDVLCQLRISQICHYLWMKNLWKPNLDSLSYLSTILFYICNPNQHQHNYLQRKMTLGVGRKNITLKMDSHKRYLM